MAEGIKPGDVSNYSALLKERLIRQANFAREFISHHGEQGRVLENSVRSVLQELLPKKFKFGSGFIVDSTKAISSQLDIVIYDDTLNSPVILDGGVGVFPVECFYGFIEVKTTLRTEDIFSFSKAVARVRAMGKENKFYVAYEKEWIEESKTKNKGAVSKQISKQVSLAPRSFLFSAYADIKTETTLSDNLAAASKETGSHIHGLCVLGANFFVHQAVHSVEPEFKFEPGDAFVNFHLRVLRGIQSMQMMPAFLDPYFEN
jgi:hypothetical protein